MISVDGERKTDPYLELEWIARLEPMPVPVVKMPFVRTRFINNKNNGCYICGRKTTNTRHHIRRGHKPMCVYVCWKHHQILHGTALNKFRPSDLRMVIAVADRYNLWKEGEKNIVKKKIIMELDMRRRDNHK